MTNQIDTQIRPEVQDVLGNLKGKIRWYVCVEGLALVLVVLELLFWISYSIDWLWFLITKFELAEWFRMGFNLFALGILMTAITYWIGLRLFRRMQNKPLALVLERRFPGLNDRLVTSVELEKTVTGKESDLTASMLNRTVEAARKDATRIQVGDVFELAPVRLAVIGALVAVISIVSYGLVDGADFNRWMKAYIGMESEYWDRETHLNVQVIAAPNDRVREFKAIEEDGDTRQVYKHPRDGDLTLLITVPKGKNSMGNPFVVPELVNVEYQTEDSTGTKTATCTKVGKRSFRLSFGSVISDMKIWVVGNDYKNRKPYHISVVAPPQTVAMNLDCDFPAYTGMNSDDTVEHTIQVLGKEVSIPLETRFLFNVETNKPLYDVSLKYGRYDLKFGSIPTLVSTDENTGRVTYKRVFRAQLESKGLDKTEIGLLDATVGPIFGHLAENRDYVFPIPEEVAKRYFRDDGKGFQLPFIISDRENDNTRAKFSNQFEDGRGLPFVMPPGSDVRIYLEDTDEIGSMDPGKLTINVKADEPPVIEAQRREIGLAVTSNASIPIYAKILDDYGITDARFEYRVAVDEKSPPGEWQPWANLENPVIPITKTDEPKPSDFPREFKFHREVTVGTILAANPENNTFTLSGNRLADIQRNDKFRVTGSTGNDGLWTVKSVSLGNNTVIEVDGNITSDSSDGLISKIHENELFEVSQIRIPDESIKDKTKIGFRDLQPGDILTLVVVAKDADNLNGPHVSRSVPELRFRIVTSGELHYILDGKETNLRIRFEQIIKEVQEVRDEFADRLQQAAEVTSLTTTKQDPEKLEALQKQIATLIRGIELTADRSKAQLSKNRNESQQIEQGFRDLRAEYVNNKLFTKKQAQRIDLDIIQKLDTINNVDFTSIDKAIINYKNKLENKEDPTSAIKDCQDRTDLMLVHMREVLDKMIKTALIGDVIRNLDALIKSQKELAEKTREEQRQEALRKLKELQKLQNP
ncbi:MAG: hypothetical protein Tsb009_38890 [Planctomycetaceae bacterium]